MPRKEHLTLSGLVVTVLRARSCGFGMRQIVRCRACSALSGLQFPGRISSTRVIGDSVELPGEPGPRVETVHLGGLDERIDARSGLSAGRRPHVQVVLSSNGKGAHRALGGIVVELKDSVLQIRAQALQTRERMADGSGERPLA